MTDAEMKLLDMKLLRIAKRVLADALVRQRALDEATERWQRWFDDPEHNPAPNPAAVHPRDAACAALAEIKRERRHDREPYGYANSDAHWSWAQRESLRQARARRFPATLTDYAP